MPRTRVLLALLIAGAVALVVALRRDRGAPEGASGGEVRARPTLRAIGPRLLSNQTSQPLAIHGEQLTRGLVLVLGSPVDRELPMAVVDERHAYARLPSVVALSPDQSQVTVSATLKCRDASACDPSVAPDGVATLTLVNDAAFPDLTALTLSLDGKRLYAASSTTDQLFELDVASGRLGVITAGDGPAALAPWRDKDGQEWLVIAHAFSPELWLWPADPKEAHKVIPAPSYAAGLVVDSERDLAYVAEHAQDSVVALELSGEGLARWRTAVGPNPRAMALTREGLVVGSLQTGEIALVDPEDGKVLRTIAPGPGTAIVGGRTEPYARFVIGGKAPRGLAFSDRLGALFASSIGPNVGPNPDRMEVSMNGGVGVIDLRGGRFLRHRGFGAGVTEALALDDRRGLLYAADVGLGVVRVLDAAKLAAGDAQARAAVVQEVAIPPPPRFPSIRPPADFSVQGRAGPELHSGPKALSLAPDGKRLFVLNRFSGTLATLDVSKPGQAQVVAQVQVAPTLGQRTRRLGQILYHADLGRTAMTCDACHLEGHTEGLFFAKTQPLRLYRSPTVRGSRDTAPYFTPASTHSLAETARVVGGRNRLHNPDPTLAEVEALALFTSSIAVLPNPYAGPDGAPPERLTLPDGAEGNPRRGLALFEGKAGCAECHPPPLFTTDQDPATRGKYLDVGTPRALALRSEWQDLSASAFAPPSLLGAWDVFPMLTSGAAGFEVADGGVAVSTRFPLRAVLSEHGGPRHGRAEVLSEGEVDDLLAYLMSL